MKISVVIPTFNRAPLIQGALLSVAAQTRPADEIIVVDDGSTDGTRAAVEALDLPNLRYIWQENAGGNVARNAGIEAASNPWIAFQDSDDYWLPHKLERMMAVMEANADFGAEAVFSSFCLFDPNKRSFRLMPSASASEKAPVRRLDNPMRQTGVLSANPISTQTLIVTRRLLDEVGRFDVKLRRFQDWDLAIRLAAAGPMLFVPEPLCYVVLGSDSVTRNYKAGLDARRHLIDKHAHHYAAHPAALRKVKKDLLVREIARLFRR